jgi:hypothetical protein
VKHDHKPEPIPPPPCKHAKIALCEKCDAVECKGCGKEWIGPAEVAKREAAAASTAKWSAPPGVRGIGKEWGEGLGAIGRLQVSPQPPHPNWPPRDMPPGTILCALEGMDKISADDFSMTRLPSPTGCTHGR